MKPVHTEAPWVWAAQNTIRPKPTARRQIAAKLTQKCSDPHKERPEHMAIRRWGARATHPNCSSRSSLSSVVAVAASIALRTDPPAREFGYYGSVGGVKPRVRGIWQKRVDESLQRFRYIPALCGPRHGPGSPSVKPPPTRIQAAGYNHFSLRPGTSPLGAARPLEWLPYCEHLVQSLLNYMLPLWCQFLDPHLTQIHWCPNYRYVQSMHVYLNHPSPPMRDWTQNRMYSSSVQSHIAPPICKTDDLNYSTSDFWFQSCKTTQFCREPCCPKLKCWKNTISDSNYPEEKTGTLAFALKHILTHSLT